jgi:hypothetical protein
MCSLFVYCKLHKKNFHNIGAFYFTGICRIMIYVIDLGHGYLHSNSRNTIGVITFYT